jgi:hypothetical protein
MFANEIRGSGVAGYGAMDRQLIDLYEFYAGRRELRNVVGVSTAWRRRGATKFAKSCILHIKLVAQP